MRCSAHVLRGLLHGVKELQVSFSVSSPVNELRRSSAWRCGLNLCRANMVFLIAMGGPYWRRSATLVLSLYIVSLATRVSQVRSGRPLRYVANSVFPWNPWSLGGILVSAPFVLDCQLKMPLMLVSRLVDQLKNFGRELTTVGLKLGVTASNASNWGRLEAEFGDDDDGICMPNVMDWNGRFLFIQSLMQHLNGKKEKK